MKYTGVVRKMDELGRLVLPSELRKTMEIMPGDPIEIMVEGQNIILRRYETRCIVCGESNDLEAHLGKLFCKKCLGKLRRGIFLE